MASRILILLLIALLFTIAFYLNHVNKALKNVPVEVLELAPQRWDEAEIRATLERIRQEPIDALPHLPPSQDRRYIVVGGCGLVGGTIVLHLLARGQKANEIRIVDIREPDREDLRTGTAAKVAFVQADITSPDAIQAAFDVKWPARTRSKPLTVFHCAAVLAPADRLGIYLGPLSAVNIQGTKNVMMAAQTSGADVFIITGSSSVSLRKVPFWSQPWQIDPLSKIQFSPDPDPNEQLLDRREYFSAYAYTKAVAERLVLAAHTPSFKTGSIRPSGIYGSNQDWLFGLCSPTSKIRTLVDQDYFCPFETDSQSFMSRNHCSFANVENVSMAHLLLERALLNFGSISGGKAFVITDPGISPTYGDVYKIFQIVFPDFRIIDIEPVLILILAHLVEAYEALRVVSRFLKVSLPRLPYTVRMIQPAMMNCCATSWFTVSTEAKKIMKNGGLEYRGICTTLEGLCAQVLRMKEDYDAAGGVEKDT